MSRKMLKMATKLTRVLYFKFTTLICREKLPLLEAYINEGLRNLAQGALMLPHYTSRDTEVGGYKVSKL